MRVRRRPARDDEPVRCVERGRGAEQVDGALSHREEKTARRRRRRVRHGVGGAAAHQPRVPATEAAVHLVVQGTPPRRGRETLRRRRHVTREQQHVVPRVVRSELHRAGDRSGAGVDQRLGELIGGELFRPQTILQHPPLAARRQRDAAAVGVGGVDGGGERAELDRRVNRWRRESRVLVQLGTLDSALVGGQRRLRRHPQARFAGEREAGEQCALGGLDGGGVALRRHPHRRPRRRARGDVVTGRQHHRRRRRRRRRLRRDGRRRFGRRRGGGGGGEEGGDVGEVLLGLEGRHLLGRRRGTHHLRAGKGE